MLLKHGLKSGLHMNEDGGVTEWLESKPNDMQCHACMHQLMTCMHAPINDMLI